MAKKRNLQMLLFCAMMVAALVVCAQIMIPLPMVPINLALFAVYLAGTLLGFKGGLACVLAYLLLGGIGVPVFAGFSGGVQALLGTTGGYLIGYLPCVAIVGLLAKKWHSFPKLCLAMFLGMLACYLFGTIWFMILMKMGFWESFLVCVSPFLIGDAVKIALAAFLTGKLRPILEKAKSK